MLCTPARLQNCGRENIRFSAEPRQTAQNDVIIKLAHIWFPAASDTDDAANVSDTFFVEIKNTSPYYVTLYELNAKNDYNERFVKHLNLVQSVWNFHKDFRRIQYCGGIPTYVRRHIARTLCACNPTAGRDSFRLSRRNSSCSATSKYSP